MTIKKQIRKVVVAWNTVRRMGESGAYKNSFGRKYLNEMAGEVIKLANKTHKYLAFYLITGKI